MTEYECYEYVNVFHLQACCTYVNLPKMEYCPFLSHSCSLIIRRKCRHRQHHHPPYHHHHHQHLHQHQHLHHRQYHRQQASKTVVAHVTISILFIF